jgi:uncharacterized membrane protein
MTTPDQPPKGTPVPSPSKTAAQRRADRIKAFGEELAQLAREKVVALTPEQRQAVAAHHAALLAQYTAAYDVDTTQHEKQLSWGMRIASFIGALALAASVFFLFYQFWGKFSTVTQVVTLNAAALLTFLATVGIAIKDRSGYFAKLAALVAFACFVLDISMLGQIFNITPSDKALILWAALAFLLAYAYDIRLLQVAGIACLVAYLSARVGTWSGMYWIYFGERPETFFPAAALMFVLPHVINHQRHTGFTAVYRICAMLILFIPMLILANYGRISYLDLDTDVIEAGYQIAGFVISAAAIALGLRKGWGEVVNTGTVFFVIFLYTKFFDWWWEIMPKYLFFLVVGLTAILILIILRRLRGYRVEGVVDTKAGEGAIP